MKHYILYILIILTAASCGLSEEPEVIKGGEVDLNFSLNIPEASEVGLKSSDENTIRSIDLLMFDENKKFMHRIQVNNVSGTGTTKTFSLRLAEASQARTFHIIANGRDGNSADIINFSFITASMDERVAMPQLKSGTLTTGTAPEKPLLMWGMVTVAGITPATNMGTINMLRSVAAIRVECAAPQQGNGLNNFSLKAFSVAKTVDMGRVAPTAYTSPAATPTAVTPAPGSSNIDYINTSGAGVWANATANITPDLYLYERSNVLDNTGLSVIIKGTYSGVEGYYKVWLKDATGQVVHVVRNHRYIIRITNVSSAGYPTLAEAINAGHSDNIFANIIDNDNDITDIIADGKYELGISSNAMTITGSGTKQVGIALKTNTAATLALSSSQAWMSGLSYTQSGNRFTISATFATTGSTRTGTITVRAGNLYRTITVTQNP